MDALAAAPAVCVPPIAREPDAPSKCPQARCGPAGVHLRRVRGVVDGHRPRRRHFVLPTQSCRVPQACSGQRPRRGGSRHPPRQSAGCGKPNVASPRERSRGKAMLIARVASRLSVMACPAPVWASRWPPVAIGARAVKHFVARSRSGSLPAQFHRQE